MDEPLGALDLKLRETMQIELRRIQQELAITTIYVTHDQIEAMNMSDRIVVMNAGRIEQMGGAEDIYNFPKTRFVADFVGQINLFDAVIKKETPEYLLVGIANTEIRAPLPSVKMEGGISVGVRPEHINLVDTAEPASTSNSLTGTLVGRTFTGNLTRLFIDVGLDKPVVVETNPQNAPSTIGSNVTLSWPINLSIILPG